MNGYDLINIILQRFACVVVPAVLFLAAQSANAQTWDGHLAKLSAAKIACRDIYSDACIPFLAQAVAVADTLYAQAGNCDLKAATCKIPGQDGSIWICDDSFFNRLNGEDLLHLTLSTKPADEESDSYWTDALLVSALNLCKNAHA